LGVILIGIYAGAGHDGSWIRAAGALHLAGIVLFSGGLYALALGAPKWLGAVTPFGGVAFILGWLAFAAAVLRS
jgi:uncharacterized membrane protein YgdD (TMEM256/DUF423 family)